MPRAAAERVDEAPPGRPPSIPVPLLAVAGVLYVLALLSLTTGPSPPGRFDIVGNIVLFVPFGCLISLAWPRLHQLAVVVAGFALSSAIELAQLLVLTSRDASLNDIALDTAGTALGCVLATTVTSVLGEVVARRRRRRSYTRTS